MAYYKTSGFPWLEIWYLPRLNGLKNRGWHQGLQIISPFSEVKLQVPTSCAKFVGTTRVDAQLFILDIRSPYYLIEHLGIPNPKHHSGILET
jgi:hypothetical protein